MHAHLFQYSDKPYSATFSISIAELQADTIVRRFPATRIASLRLHWSVPSREYATKIDPARAKNHLWGWVQEDSAADAFLRATVRDDLPWSGHERFFVTAPNTTLSECTQVLRERYWPNVKVREGQAMSENRGFFDCTKAERLLGWVHQDPEQSTIV